MASHPQVRGQFKDEPVSDASPAAGSDSVGKPHDVHFTRARPSSDGTLLSIRQHGRFSSLYFDAGSRIVGSNKL
ncbi:hypothetical protein E4U54_005916 [Claviceps lovelessii]|nr:hypothetical protein E4U54_005916 [Claviceps lovelessii]